MTGRAGEAVRAVLRSPPSETASNDSELDEPIDHLPNPALLDPPALPPPPASYLFGQRRGVPLSRTTCSASRSQDQSVVIALRATPARGLRSEGSRFDPRRSRLVTDSLDRLGVSLDGLDCLDLSFA